MKGNIDVEDLLNKMITDFENDAPMKPHEAIIYKSMLFGAVKFSVKIGIIKKPMGEKMQKRLEEICEKNME